MSGVTSYLTVCLLTETERNRRARPWFTLTNQHLPWDPNYLSYDEQENVMYEYYRKLVRSNSAARGMLIIVNHITDSTCNDSADFTDDETFANILESNVNINISDISNSDTRYGNIQSKRNKKVDSATLSKRWNCLGQYSSAWIRLQNQLFCFF